MISFRFADKESAALALTERLIELCNEKPEDPIHVALSGGESADALFECWSTKYKKQIPWERIRWYWVDERCVSQEDAESNYGRAKKLLIEQIPLKAELIHRIIGENQPEQEVIRYTKVLEENLPSKQGVPEFDIVLLGMGSDGHTASIFPGQEHLMLGSQVCSISEPVPGGLKRITLTASVLLASRHMIYFAFGPSKQPIIYMMLHSDHEGIHPHHRLLPAIYVSSLHPRCEMYHA